MVNNDQGTISHSQMKVKKENWRRNEKWRMDENIEEYKAVYSNKKKL